MNIEIEKKFLVDHMMIKEVIKNIKPMFIVQGYLNMDDPVVIVRSFSYDDIKSSILYIKGKTEGISRAAFKKNLELEEANELLILSKNSIIIKKRYHVLFEDHIWEIDIFEAENNGLIVAVVELKSEDEQIILPNWVTKEVSDDHNYMNNNLSVSPIGSNIENVKSFLSISDKQMYSRC